MKPKILPLLILLFFIFPFVLQAQNPLKIGHVNIQELVQRHPAMDSIQAILEKETSDMEDIYGEMLSEHEAKLKAFEAESSTYSEIKKEAKQTEIMELAQKIQSYNQTAQQRLQQRNMELIQPVYREINQEITNVAGHANFSYVLDISNGSVAYVSPESENITPQVLEKIGAKDKVQKTEGEE